MFSLGAFAGLAGSPIAGEIVKRDHGGFDGLSIFAGVLLFCGATGFVLARMHVAHWKVFVKI
jgi:hypothetical protein